MDFSEEWPCIKVNTYMNAVRSLLSNSGEGYMQLEAFSQIGENSDKVLFYLRQARGKPLIKCKICIILYLWEVQMYRDVYPQRREGEMGNSENVSALSARAYTTTWLVMVTYVESTCCYVLARFQGKNTLFFVMVYSALFNHVFKALNLFLNK